MAVINIEKMAQNVAEKAMQELRDNGVFIGRWIPVNEGLPEEETDVLVCCETGAITVCCGSYSTEVSDTFIWYTGGWRYGKVIAWMPLPEPYKAEGSETKQGLAYADQETLMPAT